MFRGVQEICERVTGWARPGPEAVKHRTTRIILLSLSPSLASDRLFQSFSHWNEPLRTCCRGTSGPRVRWPVAKTQHSLYLNRRSGAYAPNSFFSTVSCPMVLSIPHSSFSHIGCHSPWYGDNEPNQSSHSGQGTNISQRVRVESCLLCFASVILIGSICP